MIVKMNKLTFLIYHKEYGMFLEKLRELGVVHVEIRQTGEMNQTLQAMMQKYASHKSLLKEMTKLAESIETEKTPAKGSIDETIEGYQVLQAEVQQLNQQLPVLDREIAQMEVWG